MEVALPHGPPWADCLVNCSSCFGRGDFFPEPFPFFADFTSVFFVFESVSMQGIITLMALIENKKARLNFEILDTYEAGAELLGFEVKAIRNGMGNLEGAHVVVRGGEAFLVGATVTPYQVKNTPKSYDPERTRRLLLNKKELIVLAESEGQKGLTIVPIKWYNKSRKIKLEVAVARHKKKYDKRETLKERDTKRQIQRHLKNQSHD